MASHRGGLLLAFFTLVEHESKSAPTPAKEPMLQMATEHYGPYRWVQAPIVALSLWLMIGLGFIGFLVARHMAAYQLGYIGSAWDPFFGDGTERV